jgi:hypothetical protein
MKTTPDRKRGGAAVRGRCTTAVYVYMVKKLLDLGKKRWGLFFWFKREGRALKFVSPMQLIITLLWYRKLSYERVLLGMGIVCRG